MATLESIQAKIAKLQVEAEVIAKKQSARVIAEIHSLMAKINYVRGRQPAKYRDPKSGAEWSGRGKAPAWLASARDRKRFLIDGTANKTANAEGKAAKTNLAKGAPSKKGKAMASEKRVSTKEATDRAPALVRKAVVKKASATSAKTSAARKAAARKSTSAAKNEPRPGSKKTASRKAVTKKSAEKADANASADSAALPS